VAWTRNVREQKEAVIRDYLSDQYTKKEMVQRHGVSRQTIHKVIRRFKDDGPSGLEERSRRPKSSPAQISEEIVEEMLAFSAEYKSLSPRKVVERLEQVRPEVRWPAASTAYKIFERAGVHVPAKRRRRHRVIHPGKPRVEAKEPGELTTADFKGQFRTRDGNYCYPLTIMDWSSRYLYACQGFDSTEYGGVRRVFERVFREHGLPRVVLTDNGTPFAAHGLGRLSRFHVWLMRLGVEPVTIEPGHPEQNPIHERMHRTLKEAVVVPPANNRQLQQKRFNRFVYEYNEQRPHDSLGKRTPGSIYRPSSRPFPTRASVFEYPSHFEVRKVAANGSIKWKGLFYFLSGVLAAERVGLEPIDYQRWAIHLDSFELARFDEAQGRIYV